MSRAYRERMFTAIVLTGLLAFGAPIHDQVAKPGKACVAVEWGSVSGGSVCVRTGTAKYVWATLPPIVLAKLTAVATPPAPAPAPVIAPATLPPVTAAPVTNPPATSPPATFPPATAPSRPTPTASGFPAGQWLVPQEVQPGTYRTQATDCYYEHLRGFTGSLSDIIENGFTSASGGIVTISPSEKAFESKCDWTRIG